MQHKVGRYAGMSEKEILTMQLTSMRDTLDKALKKGKIPELTNPQQLSIVELGFKITSLIQSLEA